MIIGQQQYRETSGLLGHFFPEQGHEEHLGTKSETVMHSIMNDHNMTAFNMAKKVIKGSLVGLAFGLYASFFKEGPKKIFEQRATFNPSLVFKKYRFHAAYGALAGLIWFGIYDQLLCPHGSKTLAKHLIAYSIGGALVTMTLFNPSAVVTGSFLGLIVGFIDQTAHRKMGPKGFEVYFENFDKQKRERAKRDDAERQLSRKLAVASSQRMQRLYI